MTDTGLRQPTMMMMMMMKHLLLLRLHLPPSPHPPPCSAYPEIRSDGERQEYKREFDVDLREYKRLCAEMDDINDRLNKLSRQLDTLDDTSAKYQVRRSAELTRHKHFSGILDREQTVVNHGSRAGI